MIVWEYTPAAALAFPGEHCAIGGMYAQRVGCDVQCREIRATKSVVQDDGEREIHVRFTPIGVLVLA